MAGGIIRECECEGGRRGGKNKKIKKKIPLPQNAGGSLEDVKIGEDKMK